MYMTICDFYMYLQCIKVSNLDNECSFLHFTPIDKKKKVENIIKSGGSTYRRNPLSS